MIYSKIKTAGVKADVQGPTRGTSQSAGVDLFIPNWSETYSKRLYDASNMKKVMIEGCEEVVDVQNVAIDSYMNEEVNCVKQNIVIAPHRAIKIPMGIRVKCPNHFYYEIANRSSVASKKGLIFGAHIIDNDYQGEVFVNLINTTDEYAVLEFGEKVAQMLLKPVVIEPIIEQDDDEIYTSESERGMGGFGSTNEAHITAN